MPAWLDRAFAGLLMFGAAGHLAGSILLTQPGSELQVWSLSGVLAAAMLGVLNWLRAGRPADRPVAVLCLAGSLAWFAVAIGFGFAIHNVLDFRVLWHAFAALGLTWFSATTLIRAAGPTPSS